ncbi:uncharacterized protein [Antedon mediterranea]|uniref:uncharacterized protein n=1 Tax=Antedon mediterranea TaxID=105859 RepID=UPI003AF73BBB
MGRQKKIKAVDPFASNTRKSSLNQDSGKWNNPPKIKEQKASKMHLLMVQSMENMKKPKAKKNPAEKDESSLQKKLKKRTGETNARYLRRLNNEAHTLLLNTRMQERIKGNTEFLPPKKGMSDAQRERLNKKRERMRKKKKDHDIQLKERELFTDHVKFGEVTTKPPELLAKPRNSQEADLKPGRRNLLLKNILSNSDTSSKDEKVNSTKATYVKRSNDQRIKQTKKRKNMSESEKRLFDAAQTEAIMAYRKVKLAQIKNSKKEKVQKQTKDMDIF